MKLLIDFLVIIAFFAGYKLSGGDMMVATKVAMGATLAQLVLMKALKMPIQPMHWFSIVLIVILGSMSIFFNNPRFLQWKFSVLEWVMGAAILIGQLVFKKNMFKLLMGNELTLPEPVWTKMAWLWAGFFIFLGCLNWYIFSNYDNDVWMNFKTFWALGLTIAFVIAQGFWLSRYLPKGKE